MVDQPDPSTAPALSVQWSPVRTSVFSLIEHPSSNSRCPIGTPSIRQVIAFKGVPLNSPAWVPSFQCRSCHQKHGSSTEQNRGSSRPRRREARSTSTGKKKWNSAATTVPATSAGIP